MGDLSLTVANQGWIGAQSLHKNTRGEEVSFRIEDIATAWLDQKFVLGFLLRFGTQGLMTEDLQIDQAITQARERGGQEQRHR